MNIVLTEAERHSPLLKKIIDMLDEHKETLQKQINAERYREDFFVEAARTANLRGQIASIDSMLKRFLAGPQGPVEPGDEYAPPQ